MEICFNGYCESETPTNFELHFQTKSKDALVASIREHLSLSDSQTAALKEFVGQERIH